MSFLKFVFLLCFGLFVAAAANEREPEVEKGLFFFLILKEHTMSKQRRCFNVVCLRETTIGNKMR